MFNYSTLQAIKEKVPSAFALTKTDKGIGVCFEDGTDTPKAKLAVCAMARKGKLPLVRSKNALPNVVVRPSKQLSGVWVAEVSWS